MGNDGKYEVEGDGPDETGLKNPPEEVGDGEEDDDSPLGLVLLGLVLLGLVLVVEDKTEVEDMDMDMTAAAVAVVAVVVATAVVGGDRLVILEILEILEMLLMLLLLAFDRVKDETSGGGGVDLDDLEVVEVVDLLETCSSSWMVDECWLSAAVIFLLLQVYKVEEGYKSGEQRVKRNKKRKSVCSNDGQATKLVLRSIPLCCAISVVVMNRSD